MTVVQLRRGTTSEWTTANPILASGEEGYDTTLKQTKIGDGATQWLLLPFMDTTIGNGANLIPVDLSPASVGGWAVETTNVPVGSAKAFSTTINRFIGSANSSGFTPIDENRIYRYSFDIHSSIVGMKSYLSGNWKTKTNTAITATPYISLNNTTLANGWATISGFIGPGMPIVPPAGTAGFNPYIYANHTNGTQGGVLTISDFRVIDVTEVVDLIRDPLYAATSTTSGSLASSDKAKLDRMLFDVKAFGAVGDGVANDGLAIQNAVNAAKAAGGELFWPAGTYLKTVNITSFHTVKHVGTGVVKHGADLFYVNPIGTQANKIYVSTTGASDTYDGISSSFPARKLGYAVGILENYGPVVQGVWTIQLTAGTWADRTIVPENLAAVHPVTVQGPIVNHPNVPTAVISEGYNISAVAFKILESNVSFILSNLHFSGYNGTTSSAGVQSSGALAETYLVNCHFTDCFWGYTNQASKGDVKGGIFRRCGYLGNTANNVAKSSRSGNGGGYRGLMAARHSIGLQGAGVLTNGPYFYDNVSGIFAQETCTGHVDYCTFEDNDFGVNINVNTRANVDGSSFKRNKIDLRGIANSHFYVSSANVFGTGVDESTIKLTLVQGSQITDSSRLFTNVDSNYNITQKIVDTVFPNTVVNTTSNTVVYTATLAGNLWRDGLDSTFERKRLTVRVYGEFAGTAGTKAITVRLGTSNVTATFTSSETGTFEAEAIVFLTDKATQYMRLCAMRHLGANVRLAQASATNALTADTNLTVESLVGVATDSVTISVVELSWA